MNPPIIGVGVGVIVESQDGRVLITRRAKHMRTFPGVWVPPGGHVGKTRASCFVVAIWFIGIYMKLIFL